MGKSYMEKVKSRESRKGPGSSGKRKEDGDKGSPLAPLIFLGVILLLTAAGIFYAVGGSDLLDSGDDGGGSDDDDNDVTDGSDQVPDYMKIQLDNVNGGTFTLEEFRGKMILLDMFAIWCEPCKYQIEELKDFTSVHGEDQLIVISVDVDQRETPSEISDFREDYGATWRFASYSPQLSQQFPASAIPTLYLLDRSGEQVMKHEGAKSASELEGDIGPYITPT